VLDALAPRRDRVVALAPAVMKEPALRELRADTVRLPSSTRARVRGSIRAWYSTSSAIQLPTPAAKD
jgi:hypothetical protein